MYVYERERLFGVCERSEGEVGERQGPERG